MIRYQRARDGRAPGCLSANSFKRFLVMTCTKRARSYPKLFPMRSIQHAIFSIPQASFQAELFSDRTRQCVFDFGVTRYGNRQKGRLRNQEVAFSAASSTISR